MIKLAIRALVTVAPVLLLLATVTHGQVASPQPQSSWSGKYEGTFKHETGEQKMTLDLLDEAGKFSGQLNVAGSSYKILKGQIVDGTLKLEVEKTAGTVSAGTPEPKALYPGLKAIDLRRDGNQATATIPDAGKSTTVTLKKVVADDISGEWDAIADAQGQAFPFTLTLKLEGDKISGTSASQLGTSNISSGSWKDGKLALVLEGSSGQIALAATMVEGKLSGEYDFAGQLQGKWVAIRKK